MSQPEWFLFTCLRAIGCLDRRAASFVYSGTTGSIFLLYWWFKPLISWAFFFCVKKMTLATSIYRMNSILWPHRSTFLLTTHHCNTPTQRQLNKSLLFPYTNFMKGLYTGLQLRKHLNHVPEGMFWKKRGIEMNTSGNTGCTITKVTALHLFLQW